MVENLKLFEEQQLSPEEERERVFSQMEQIFIWFKRNHKRGFSRKSSREARAALRELKKLFPVYTRLSLEVQKRLPPHRYSHNPGPFKKVID